MLDLWVRSRANISAIHQTVIKIYTRIDGYSQGKEYYRSRIDGYSQGIQ